MLIQCLDMMEVEQLGLTTEASSGINLSETELETVEGVLMSLQRAKDLEVIDLEETSIDPIDEVLSPSGMSVYECSSGDR